MFEHLSSILLKKEELERRLSEPQVASDAKLYRETAKEIARISPLAEAYAEYLSVEKEIEDTKELLGAEKDPDMLQVAKEELSTLLNKEEELQMKLRILLLPKDPHDEKNVFLEIRAGAGGDEAALFAAELYRMYMRYAESRAWRTELVSVNENGLGGFKEAVVLIEGQGAYSRLKYESGVHRVQRVPETESGGRIHTSTVTVAVMPEAEEVEVEIRPEDLRIDVYRSSGAGGQHVNKTSSAIRITHLPTGIVVQCQNERSQFQNKDEAMRMLRARLFEIENEKKQSEISEDRRTQVGTGDRSEKIRTYNFPQSRVTDHRIKLTSHRLSEILGGDLDEILNALIADHQSRLLAES